MLLKIGVPRGNWPEIMCRAILARQIRRANVLLCAVVGDTSVSTTGPRGCNLIPHIIRDIETLLHLRGFPLRGDNQRGRLSLQPAKRWSGMLNTFPFDPVG